MTGKSGLHPIAVVAAALEAVFRRLILNLFSLGAANHRRSICAEAAFGLALPRPKGTGLAGLRPPLGTRRVSLVSSRSMRFVPRGGDVLRSGECNAGHSCFRNLRLEMDSPTKRILKITAQILIALPLLSALAGLILGPTVLHPFRHRLSVRQAAQADQLFTSLNAAREDFVVRANDGTILDGWKARPVHPNGDWVLLLHGRSHNRSAMLPYAQFLVAAGYSVVMMDARAHGNSGGSMSTYGQLEIFDMHTIVKSLESTEKVGHLFALGESMGAAVSLQSPAFAPQIEAVVAEGAFRNLREVTFDYAGLQQSAFLGKTLFRPAALVAVWIAQKQGGFRFEDISPEKAVVVRSFPILLVCGASDRKIPCRHSEAIFNSAIGPKELWKVPGTGHEQAINTSPAEFQRRVLDFFHSISDPPRPVQNRPAT